MKRLLNHYAVLCFLYFVFSFSLSAQNRLWTLEAESPKTAITWRGDTADIISPQGTTLWRKEKMKGNVVIEYDARVVVEDGQSEEWNRLSDLNCFWMASDPKASDVFARMKQRGGKFVNTYQLQLYYLGFGGNYNKTTRFRRYTGDERGVEDGAYRPAILKEYTDEAHLLKPNHWYHIRLECKDGRVKYWVDGECLVNYLDPQPLTEGWFGFRTTLSHTQICHFKYEAVNPNDQPIELNWISSSLHTSRSTLHASLTTFGVPFGKGEVTEKTGFSLKDALGNEIEKDTWTLAWWPDGSVKWQAFAAVAPQGKVYLTKTKTIARTKTKAIHIFEQEKQIKIDTGTYQVFIPKQGKALVDSITMDGKRIGGEALLRCSYDNMEGDTNIYRTERINAVSRVDSAIVERRGDVSCVVKICGWHETKQEKMLPFTVRLYAYAGSNEMKWVHSFVIDSLSAQRRISSLGISFDVPFREANYNRHIRLGNWTESVQPLAARRLIRWNGSDAEFLQVQQINLPNLEDFGPMSRSMIEKIALWDKYRLSQLSPNGFSIRKAATELSPWIGTKEGQRANGTMWVGDVSGGIAFALKDFWQSFPSTLEIRHARSNTAEATVWLWSPEAEPMNLAHYDSIAHTLDAAYEDVQEGMSTAYGVARSSVLYVQVMDSCPNDSAFADIAQEMQSPHQLVCTPEYLHRKRAFGIWSLPDYSTSTSQKIEERLKHISNYYEDAVERYGWYGFWNYGDVMHQFDAARGEWRYDVGGYAWDNTELASNMLFWYDFLRTGDAGMWRMADAMTRHTGEVDVYHMGPNSMLGSRHNVSHWGCGAKEARISQAAWNRFYYYLTADERCGDLMREVKDADQMLYTLDPMRLAQPRGLFPCTAPARLRIGPDWLAYAGNWMTEWERTKNPKYRDKIVAGMKSIAALRHGIFSGPKALGFDPATGIITNECDSTLQNTNHLLPIMGGFEVMNEMMEMIDLPEWHRTWLTHARDYKRKALEISNNHFLIPRLSAYAGWLLPSEEHINTAWRDLLRFELQGGTTAPVQSTNDAATWTLDAIFMQEVCPR
ncbi:MAG: hypothetical protein IJ910_03445 [Bacteroidaceae bacterium]|nr:hypothetical protein [Bacteroidaceae bacterium]